MPKYRFHFKCARCGRPIKTGQEQWLHGSPYGIQCYQVIVRMEIDYANKIQQDLRDSTVAPKSSS